MAGILETALAGSEMRDKLRDMLIHHEGCRLKPYKDSVGKLTIGIGRNIQDQGITKDEALFMLDNDIKVVEWEAQSYFPWYITLDDDRKAAVLDMLFNLGATRMRAFVKFLDAMSKKDYELASVEMLDSVWAKQVGERALELAGIILGK